MNSTAMELTRRAAAGMLCFLLLGSGSVRGLPEFNSTADINPKCFNDFIDSVRCEFEGRQCPQYKLTLQNKYVKAECRFEQCADGQCCCSATDISPVLGEIIHAVVWRGARRVTSKDIDVTYSIKPRVPTNVSVEPSNGNFQVRWKSNMEANTDIDEDLEAVVTYYKKGDPLGVQRQIKPATVGQQKLKFYEISGQNLEPSTTYVVTVKSYLSWSGFFSDPSKEVQFTTSRSHDSTLVDIIVILSISAVLLMAAMCFCYFKVKAMYWDGALTSTHPKLLDLRPSEQKLLKPALPHISSVCVEQLFPKDVAPWRPVQPSESSEGGSARDAEANSGSTLLSYVNTAPLDVRAGVLEALGSTLAGIGPRSFMSAGPTAAQHASPPEPWASDTSAASSGLYNQTYSIVIPSLPAEAPPPAPSSVGIECDFAYRPSEGQVGSEQVPPAPLLLCAGPPAAPLVLDDTYQQCNSQPGGSAHAGPGHLVAQLRAAALTRVHQNPSCGVVSAGPSGFLPMEDEYQPFQGLRQGQEGPSRDQPGPLSAPYLPLPSSAQVAAVDAVAQRPFLPLLSAGSGSTVLTDSGYHGVLC